MLDSQIEINQNFQTAINIAYDYYSNEKISSFIPTASACDLLDTLLRPALENGLGRAKVLIGAYGRGKSHAVLVASSVLGRKDPGLFDKLIEGTRKVSPGLSSEIEQFTNSKKRLLPVIISRNSSSLTQTFLHALRTSLEVVGLGDVMPQTGHAFIIETINLWRERFPETYSKLGEMLSKPIDDFIIDLAQYNKASYKEFVDLYPELTAGSSFDTFQGLDPVEAYVEVANRIGDMGYSGLYVVYDEFSKFLESSIADAPIEDIKLLQDFAEACDRSSDTAQMHILLICHKDISNYIDEKLSKRKVDGWRGVSGRFEHIEVAPSMRDSYELMDAVIKPKKGYLSSVKKEYADKFTEISNRYKDTQLFREVDAGTVMDGCFPLHPVTSFCLPRISEKVAQNERTLFTFLAANERDSLPQLLKKTDEAGLAFIKPTVLYDYFEPLFKRERQGSEMASIYELSSRALSSLQDAAPAEEDVIKTIALAEIVRQHEVLSRDKTAIIELLSDFYQVAEIEAAIKRLSELEGVILVRASDNKIQLKPASGFHIEDEVAKRSEQKGAGRSYTDALNRICAGRALYPSRYNCDNNIVRYFDCCFVDAAELAHGSFLPPLFSGDGLAVAVVSQRKGPLKSAESTIRQIGNEYPHVVFSVAKEPFVLTDELFKLEALSELRDDYAGDTLITDELNILISDYSETVNGYVRSFFNPVGCQSNFYIFGKKEKLRIKSQLSEKLSAVCDSVFPNTPIVNNEAINKNVPTGTAIGSRKRILNGLSAPVLQPNLGFTGTGQEFSIMRSVFSVTNIIVDIANRPTIRDIASLKEINPKMGNVFGVIDEFARYRQSSNVAILYEELMGFDKGIGLKRGLVILLIAAYCAANRQNIVIYHAGEEAPIRESTFSDMDAHPDEYMIHYEDITSASEVFVDQAASIFADFINGHEIVPGGHEHVANAIDRWYLQLPRFARGAKKKYVGGRVFEDIPQTFTRFLDVIKDPTIGSRKELYEAIPEAFECNLTKDLPDGCLHPCKEYYDTYINATLVALLADCRAIFSQSSSDLSSTAAVLNEWGEQKRKQLDGYLFPGIENKVIDLLGQFSNDELSSMREMCKLVTGLRIEDWDEKVLVSFLEELNRVNDNVEAFLSNNTASAKSADMVTIALVSKDGERVTRSFERVECSKRAQLLRNEVVSAIGEMGRSITEAEKRQVLIDVLTELF